MKIPDFCKMVNGANMGEAIISGFYYQGNEVPVLLKIYEPRSEMNDIYEQYIRLLLENKNALTYESYCVRGKSANEIQYTATINKEKVEIVYINKLSGGKYFVGYSQMSSDAYENIGQFVAASFTSTQIL